MPKKKTRKLIPTPKYRNHAYINPDGTVDGERLLKLVQNTPGALLLMVANGVIEQKNPQHAYDVEELISGIANLLMLAVHGDEDSANQLKAIEKLIRPVKYDLPFTKIREIIKYETSAPLARGWELRRIMSNLANVVEPLKKDRPYTPDQPIIMRENPSRFWNGLSDLARQHFKRNSTLQSLAIHIYLEQLQKQGVTDEGEAISEKSLKRDLARVREWEKTASEDDKLRRGSSWGGSMGDGERIVWYGFSEGWKERKKSRNRSAKRKGDKQPNKLRGVKS